ncbi:hypothetical protein ACTWLT_12385 [Micromonospora sp. ZYX-F-536]|uniref:hypothetical protein n=1 Tax=Micromonospora sp. ZYX-F-536 TaxID=3457629 RepID=UPI0040407F9E
MARAADRAPWPALPDGSVGGWSATARGLWPELPDDQPLWTVPGEALDAAQHGRLDREQAGG